MNIKVLMLSIRLRPGFGVAVVIDELSNRLRARGVDTVLAALELEGDYLNRATRLNASTSAIQRLIQEQQITHVIAHSSPFMELLPSLSGVMVWAWEHGEPDPAFFSHDRDERIRQLEGRRRLVYPNVDKVIAISEFIREQIHWPAAQVIRNGWEHAISSLSQSPERTADLSNRPLKIGALTRMGKGEALYKGPEELLALQQHIRHLNVDFAIMGRGTAEDVGPFQAAGFSTFPNASDEERNQFLNDIDIFVTTSLWEGCNLPLLEAQANGALGLALDTGAHPEYSYVVCSTIAEMAQLITSLSTNRHALERLKIEARNFACGTFSWDTAADKLLTSLVAN